MDPVDSPTSSHESSITPPRMSALTQGKTEALNPETISSTGTSAGNGKPIPQEHEQLWTLMSQIPRKAQRGLLMQCELVLTCVDATKEYIALGTNIGLVFLFNREKQTLERLKTDSTDVVICIKLHHGLDYQLAVGLMSGIVRIFLLPSTSLGQNKMLQKLDVKDLHKSSVMCIEWSPNGMKLFSADKNGRVVVNLIDFYEGQSKSTVLMEEDKTDSEIVQLSYDHRALLVSTKYRTVICRTDEDSRVIQVGQKERKITGNLGACFIPGQCKPSDAKLYAARPGCRIWQAGMNGAVENTYIFKDVLSENNPTIHLLKLENLTPKKEEAQFGRLTVYRENELLSWQGGNLFILQPTISHIVCVQSRIGLIVDVAVNNDEIFVLRKNTEINLIRLAVEPEVVKNTGIPIYRMPVEPKLNSPASEENKTVSNLTKINEELKSKGQSAKGFFQKNVIGKLKNLELKPGAQNIQNEPSVKPLMDANDHGKIEPTTPDLPPVVKLKTPDLPGLQVFEDRSASSSNSPSPEKRGSTVIGVNNDTSVARPSILYYPSNDSHSFTSSQSELSQKLTTSSTSSNMQEKDEIGDIVFSHKIKKVKKRKNKAEKGRDLDIEDDDDDVKPVHPVSPQKIAASLNQLDQFQSKSILPADIAFKPSNDNMDGLSALSRADEILKKSLSVISSPEPEHSLTDSGSFTGGDEEHGSLGYREALKLKSWDKNKMAEDDTIKIEIKEVKDDDFSAEQNSITKDAVSQKSSSDKSLKLEKSNRKHSASYKSTPDSSMGSEYSRTLSREDSVDSVGETSPSETSADDFYSIYKRSDSSSSSITSPFSSFSQFRSPETEAYQARPSASRPAVNRLDSIEGKINYTANIFDDVITGANTYSLSVSDSHVWLADKSENIWYSALSGPKIIWRKAADPGTQIAVSRSGRIIWRLHKNIAYAGTKITSKRPEGLKWVDVAKEVAYIAVDDSSAWYIKPNGKVMMQKGLTKDRPCFRSSSVTCPNELKQIACCNHVVWAITTDMKIMYRVGITENCEEGTSWELMNCGIDSVESLLFGHVCLEQNNGWAIDVLGRIWFLPGITMEQPTGSGKWWQVPLSEYFVQDATALDNLKSLASKFDPQKLSYLISSNRGGLISASLSGIWVCPEYKSILHVCRGNILGFRWDDCQPIGIAASTVWKLVCADLVHLDWGLVWAQQPNGDIYTFPSDTRVGSMVTSSPLFTCISACHQAVWGLTSDGRVYARSGMGPFCPQGSCWSELDLSQLGDVQLLHLSCNSQYIWAVDCSGMVYQRIGTKSPADQQLSPIWLPLDSFSGLNFNYISVGAHFWMVWAVDSRRLAYVRMGITENLPIGKEWKNVPGIQVMKLSISETGVWALNPQGEVFFRHGITEKNVLGDYWKKVPGLCSTISVSCKDEVWNVSLEGRLMHLRTKHLHRRDAVDACAGTMRTMSIGSDEGEWELV